MIRLHHVPFSRSFRVLWALEELGLDYELVRYRIEDGSLRTPEMLAVNPAGRVPALEIDGISLFESGAILQYLAETRPQADLAPQVGAPDRARYLEWIGFAETMASMIENLNLSQIFLRDPSQASPTVIKLTTARLRAALKAMETRITGPFLLERFSMADCMMGFNLFAAPYYVPLEPFSKLLGYRDGLTERPAYQRARERDGPQTIYAKDFYPVPADV